MSPPSKIGVSFTLSIISLGAAIIGYSYMAYFGIKHSNVVGMSAMGSAYIFIATYLLTTVSSSILAVGVHLTTKDKLAKKISKVTLLIVSLPTLALIVFLVIESSK